MNEGVREENKDIQVNHWLGETTVLSPMSITRKGETYPSTSLSSMVGGKTP